MNQSPKMLNSYLLLVCLAVAASEIAAWGPYEHPKFGRHLGARKSKSAGVEQMSISEFEKLGSALLLRGAPIDAQVPKLNAGAPFHWESCGTADQLVNIRNLTFQPSPLSFPGPLSFGFDIEFRDTITADAKVSADVKLEIDARGTWITIPCIGGIGSCKYDDLCSLMQQHVHCPTEILDKGIPCACPFDKGEYKLKEYSVNVDATVFPSGDYRAQVVMTNTGSAAQIACYKLTFSVE